MKQEINISMKLYDDPHSGNGYKIRLLLAYLNIKYEYIPVDILNGDTRTAEFLAKNPNGRIPLLELEDGSYLAESNAILYFLAQSTAFWPKSTFDQALVLQWMFFEQHSHEPNIATARFWLSIKKGERDQFQSALLAQKQSLGRAALEVMEQHLTGRQYFVGDHLTIADIALYAYTHVADEGGFDLSPYKSINAWLSRICAHPRHCAITEWKRA